MEVCIIRRWASLCADSSARSMMLSRKSRSVRAIAPISSGAEAGIGELRLPAVITASVPARYRSPARAAASLGALAAATELFGWMVRNPDKKLARALAKPGHELQHRYATKEPSPEQVEVAEAALRACLQLETA